MDEEEGVAIALELRDGFDCGQVTSSVGIIAECVFSRPDVEATVDLRSVSGEMVVLPACSSRLDSLVANRIFIS